jgi:hypothetical protein
MMKYAVLFIILMAAAILQGCSITDKGDTYRSAPTIGQDLVDLDRARETGAINDAEFDRLKDRIIRR